MRSAQSRIFFFILTLLFFVGLFLQLFPKTIKAAISGCSATVSPGDSQPNVSVQFNFSITNNDSSNSINRIEIYTPHPDITIQNYSIYPAWNNQNNSDSIIFTSSGTPLAAGASINPSLTVQIGDLDGASGSWAIDVSDDAGGSSMITCSGNLDLSVSAQGTDVTAPSISNVVASSISNSSAVITWTTNESSNSLVQYDVNADEQIYPFSGSSTQMVTSHSITITQGLGSGTTYYYRVCSTDAANNQACSNEYSFTTTSSAATATPAGSSSGSGTSTPTPTGAKTATPTPIPTDRTKPNVTITTDLSGSFESAPLIEGKATDSGTVISGVSSLHYSTDGGDNWLPVDDSDGLGTSSVEFSFTPYIFDDGNYDILVRAIDGSGNEGRSDELVLVIDRLPPSVGGNLISLGPQVLLPNEDGVIVTIAGLELKITLSAVGGPTNIDLFINEEQFSLDRSDETGLWSGFINLRSVGLYQLRTEATDGAGNKTERNLNPVLAVEPGKITSSDSGKKISSGEVTVYVQDPESKIWTVWDGATFSQDNPQKLTEDGNYQFYLPGGTYYLTIAASGFSTQVSKIFHLSENTPFNADFELEKRSSANFFGLFSFDIFSEKLGVTLKKPKYQKESFKGNLVGTSAFDFDLPTTSERNLELADFRGEQAVISFVSTWSPPSVEQIRVLNDLAKDEILSLAIVSTQETLSKVAIFVRKGGYESEIVVDSDGALVEEYGVNSLPAHVFLDRGGKITNVVSGVLNKDEFKNLLE